MPSGVSGGGNFFFSEVKATARNSTRSVTAVDDALATEEAASSPKLEAIVLRRGCGRQMTETRVSLIGSVQQGNYMYRWCPRTLERNWCGDKRNLVSK